MDTGEQCFEACVLQAYALDFDLVRALTLAHARSLARAHALNFVLDPELVNSLKRLKATLSRATTNDGTFWQWWQANGTEWVERLRQVMIQHRNLGHDWQLTDQQKQQFWRYYNVNRFLVELIKIEGAVSDRVRTEIEDGLLLPWEELQGRYPDTYGQSQSP